MPTVRVGKMVVPNGLADLDEVWDNLVSPGLVVKGPYEQSVSTEVMGRKMTAIFQCVDILLPSGKFINGVNVKHLERI